MLRNQKQQLGLMGEDEALGHGLMGLFSANPNSNGLASFLPPGHGHHFVDSGPHGINPHHFSAACAQPCSIRSDAEEEDDDNINNHNSSGAVCEEALLFNSCPKLPTQHPLHQHHIDLLSLHHACSNPWETMGMMEGDNESVEDGTEKKKNKVCNSGLGVVSKSKKKKLMRRKAREPRFSFKTLSDVDVLDDGYKWRKYGQKVVKNTHHPRSYYRCTQEKCSVKKKVERLAEDPRMVITTYEGRHYHSPAPLHLEDDHHHRSSNATNFFF